MTGATVLEARGVTRLHGALEVLGGVSMGIAAGEWVSLIGPSGCGKTTLLQVLGLLDRPTSGQVLVDGDDGWSHGATWRARARLGRIGFVFQSGNLLGHLSARENVALPAWRRTGSRAEAFRAADELLERFGLGPRAAAPARVLSGGEAQRVAIARSLVGRPAVVLADEPTGSLDSASAAKVLEALAEIAVTGAALLLVTHDPDVAARGSRVLTMRDGRLVGADGHGPSPRS